MTQDTTQPESEQQETAAGDPICGQHHGHDSNHLRLSTNDSASDNDTGERPVREKLKKTSIASMPRDDAMAKSIDAKVEAILSTNSKEPREHNSSNDETPSPISEPRGRLSRKRSYDDSIETSSGAGRDSPEERPDDDDAKQARKRSRDIRALHSKTLESLTTPTNQWSPERELEGSKSGKDEALDQELEESAQSPRKKRSREDIDVDPQRGQKIAATEEAKAYRRSEDSERGHVPLQDDKGTFTVDSTVHEEQRPTSEESSASQQNQFPQAEIDPPEPASQRAPEAANVEEKAPQKAPTSFAASGFAAMSNSSESPFGTFGASTPSTFRPAPAPTSTTLGLARNNTVEPQTTQTTTSSAFGNSPSPFLTSTTASTGLTGFGFGANGAAPKPSGFGGSVFGSGFMNKGAAAPKLTSFAAPTGDLAPPKPAESIKALGTQGEDSADEEGGSDDEANPGEVGAAEVEVDSRFQQQEGIIQRHIYSSGQG